MRDEWPKHFECISRYMLYMHMYAISIFDSLKSDN